jgi:hypothetical protein
MARVPPVEQRLIQAARPFRADPAAALRPVQSGSAAALAEDPEEDALGEVSGWRISPEGSSVFLELRCAQGDVGVRLVYAQVVDVAQAMIQAARGAGAIKLGPVPPTPEDMDAEDAGTVAHHLFLSEEIEGKPSGQIEAIWRTDPAFFISCSLRADLALRLAIALKESFRKLSLEDVVDMSIPPHLAHQYLDQEYKRLDEKPASLSAQIGLTKAPGSAPQGS